MWVRVMEPNFDVKWGVDKTKSKSLSLRDRIYVYTYI